MCAAVGHGGMDRKYSISFEARPRISFISTRGNTKLSFGSSNRTLVFFFCRIDIRTLFKQIFLKQSNVRQRQYFPAPSSHDVQINMYTYGSCMVVLVVAVVFWSRRIKLSSAANRHPAPWHNSSNINEHLFFVPEIGRGHIHSRGIY